MKETDVFVITGFLGSGKTTLLNHLVNSEGLKDTAVIINEFGEIGIDHMLVESAFEDAVVLANGCLCCTIRGDILDTLETLLVRRKMGLIPEFKRVIIETTGLADPAPILQTLISAMVRDRGFRLKAIVTTIDACHAMAQFDRQFEARKQAAIADLLLVTKTDIAMKSDIEPLRQRLVDYNPNAEIKPIALGAIDPAVIVNLNAFEEFSDRFETIPTGHDHHDEDIQALSLTRVAPLPWARVREWLQSLASLRGADIIRLKGVLNIEGCDRPVAINGVQSSLYPPKKLSGWAGQDKVSNIVLIGRNIPKQGVEQALDNILAAH